MRYLATLFWTFILGQVVGYLGSSLAGATYDFQLTSIISLVAGVLIILLGLIAPSPKRQVINRRKPVTFIVTGFFFSTEIVLMKIFTEIKCRKTNIQKTNALVTQNTAG